ncbi:MAG: GTPase Era [Betaproteobacteria bacterium]|nr:GTPase Era [Betaproteobacteria bacterium]
MNGDVYRCGTVALIGRPNVGKSTLLNALIGTKLSITSNKPQTTRHRIRGVITRPDAQFIFVDTPGFQTRHKSALNRVMNRGIRAALDDVDAVILVVEAGILGTDEMMLLKQLPESMRVLLVVNKTDRTTRDELIPFLAEAGKRAAFSEILPVSAQKKKGIGELLDTLKNYLPVRGPIFDETQYTDRSERFIATELVREKLFRLLGDELPYGASVVIEKFEEVEKRHGTLRRIFATIILEKESHKAIVVGEKASKLKEISRSARLDMERQFGDKVYLELWVKIRDGWTDDEAAVRRLGYE